MKTRIALAFLIVLLTGAATARETAYNQGVSAFREKDYSLARLHWTRATEENVRAAYNNLGYLLYVGLGGASEPERAVSLWTIAARSGDRESQWHLAQAFEAGKGVNRDIVAAYAWYRCADANFEAVSTDDEEDAVLVRDTKISIARLIGRLSIEQLRESEILARKYIDAYPYSEQYFLSVQKE
jgi:hypothetical protein